MKLRSSAILFILSKKGCRVFDRMHRMDARGISTYFGRDRISTYFGRAWNLNLLWVGMESQPTLGRDANPNLLWVGIGPQPTLGRDGIPTYFGRAWNPNLLWSG